MGTFLSVLLDILAILVIIIVGSLVVVIFAELILHLIDGGKGKKDKDKEETTNIIKDNDIVVYSNQENPNGIKEPVKQDEFVGEDKVQAIDYDKAVEEQKMLQGNKVATPAPAPKAQSKPVEKQPDNKDIFWDDEEEDEFDKVLDGIIKEAKKSGTQKVAKPEPVAIAEAPKNVQDEQMKKELEELKALKAQQEKEIQELKQKNESLAKQPEKQEQVNAEIEELKKQHRAEIEEFKALMKQNEENSKREYEGLKELRAQQEKEIAEFRLLREDFEKSKQQKQEVEPEVVEVVEDNIVVVDEKPTIDEETRQELEELRRLKEQQQKEIEEFRQMKEDFAREKEEQLDILKDNLNKAKEEEIERIRQDALKEQARLEEMQRKLEEEKLQIEEEKAKLKEDKNELTKDEGDILVEETIIKDEEQLNKMKYKNLMRMNNRLTRIVRDTERLQTQKQKDLLKAEEEKKKLLEKQEQERQREQERLVELERQEQEKLAKEQEENKKAEIAKKLQEASMKAGKYKLDTKVVRLTRNRVVEQPLADEIKEVVVPADDEDTGIELVDKVPLKATSKPVYDKAFYENRLKELEEEKKEVEKDLRQSKAEYIPLTRIHRAYARDGEKLRKKELQVAKQKVALYGVNSKKIDPAKKEKLDENLQALAELKDSVQHCEEIIKKNKDRYPVIQKNYQLISKEYNRINEDIKVCERAIEYYNKNK